MAGRRVGWRGRSPRAKQLGTATSRVAPKAGYLASVADSRQVRLAQLACYAHNSGIQDDARNGLRASDRQRAPANYSPSRRHSMLIVEATLVGTTRRLRRFANVR